MDLQEEYFGRKKVPAFLIKYADRASLILRAKPGANVEWNWIQVSINSRADGNHPNVYHFVVSANPVIYASADFSHFSYNVTKELLNIRWEWEDYENNLLNWAKKQRENYVAVTGEEAVFVSWEMFLVNYDSWLANFLPNRVIDWICDSLVGDKASRLASIVEVEKWISSRYDKIYACWQGIKQNIDNRCYADWLGAVVNGSGD